MRKDITEKAADQSFALRRKGQINSVVLHGYEY